MYHLNKSYFISGILQSTNLHHNLEMMTAGTKFVIYGNHAYPLLPLLSKPFEGAALQPHEVYFNKSMSRVWQAVEWGFGKVVSEFAFVHFHKNQRMPRQRIGRMYRMATLLSNCHTCLYGSLMCDYFGVGPPSLDEYLMPSST